AHYAAGDTAAAFFALLTVYLAVRIVETGRARHYLLGALAVAAAFSSKYNGAVAALALGVAHLVRHPGRALLSGLALRRAAAAVGALAVGAALTSPALLVNPGWTIASIRDFMAWVATYHLNEAVLRLPLGERFLLGLRNNGLLVLRATGIFALAGVPAALALARPRSLVWVIAATPAAHLLIAFTAKPVGHAVHHLPIILPLLVLGAAGMASLLARKRPLLVRAGGGALAAATLVWLAAATRDELFFFSRSDTLRVAETWARDSIPPAVAVTARRAFPQPPAPSGSPRGTVEFLPARVQRQPQAGEFHVTRFFLEESSLPVFRNQTIDAIVQAPALLAPTFDLPLWLPQPSVRADDLVFVEAPVFYRSPMVRDVGEGAPFDLTVVSRQPLERAWIILRGGAAPASLSAGFGGHAVERVLGPGELAVIPVERPRQQRSPYQGNRFYRWTATARFGSVRVALVTDEAILGRYWFNEGRFAEAWKALSASGGHSPPGRKIEQAISGVASGSLTPSAAEALAEDLLGVPSWDRDE
ncbi:MAG TPA: glycosyltransferase family 39 protein, partial [Vicinamibacteria bacterium]